MSFTDMQENEQPRYPICVPSKARPGARLFSILRADGLDHWVFVEPQEREAYLAAGVATDRLVVLGDHDRGIAFARQSILQHAKNAGWEWFWQIDDNISGFGLVAHQRIQKASAAQSLASVEQRLEHAVSLGHRFALAAAENGCSAWGRRLQESYDSPRMLCCVLSRVGTGCAYDESVSTKEDFDWALQHLARGWRTLLAHAVAYNKPAMKSQKGGCEREYASGRDIESAWALCRKWPRYVSLVQKPSRIDVSVKWKKL